MAACFLCCQRIIGRSRRHPETVVLRLLPLGRLGDVVERNLAAKEGLDARPNRLSGVLDTDAVEVGGLVVPGDDGIVRTEVRLLSQPVGAKDVTALLGVVDPDPEVVEPLTT